MSLHAMAWALEQQPGGPISKVILLAIANYIGKDEWACWTSQKTLAIDASVSERTLRDHLVALEEVGLIAREERSRPDGSRATDIITFPTMPLPSANAAGTPGAARPTPRRTAPDLNQESNLRKINNKSSDPTEKKWVLQDSVEWEAVRRLRGRSPPTMQQGGGGAFGWFIPVDEIGKAMAS